MILLKTRSLQAPGTLLSVFSGGSRRREPGLGSVKSADGRITPISAERFVKSKMREFLLMLRKMTR